MTRLYFASLLVAFVVSVSAQYEGWTENQVNASICLWGQPRAAVIRDTVYLDGGLMLWSQGLSSGEYGPIDSKGNRMGLMFTFNFSQPFSTSDNLTALLEPQSKARGGFGSDARDDAPNFFDGALLGNDEEVTLFGGLVKKTDADRAPDGNEVLTYERYQDGEARASFRPSFVSKELGDGMTRYITDGGAANAPSENKAWYFGGMRGPEWGPIYQRTTNMSETAANVSHTLITLDMSGESFEQKWTNKTLEDDIQGRANPEVVWVPVGEQGILVVIGGVTYPDWVSATRKSENPAQSKEESDKFMQDIDVYDIANDRWYKQPSEGAPTASTRGCSVLASAQDFSSHNIYYYGGYPGVDPSEDFSDEVWVLSLPSFTWTRVTEMRLDFARTGHSFARAGHKCFKPYPDQMLTFGGTTQLTGVTPACLRNDSVIQAYNLSSAEWMDSYDPREYADYTVPSAVLNVIGGDPTGSATATTPAASGGWVDDELADVFETKYDTDKIKQWFPYPVIASNSRPTVPNDGGDDNGDNGGGGGGGTPKWLAPVLGVVLSLVFLTALLVAFCLWRKRRHLRGGDYSAASTDENGMRILSWMRGQHSIAKDPTVTTEETKSNGDMADAPRSPPVPFVVASTTPHNYHQGQHAELHDTGIAELPDTSRPPELHDTGLTPVDIIAKHSHFAAPGARPSGNPSSYYGSVSGNEESSISHSSGVLGVQSRGQSPSPVPPGPPSPPMLAGRPGARASNVSGLSERETSHLRQISEATVSSATTSAEKVPQVARPAREDVGAPTSPGAVSPPSGGLIEEGDDYVSAKSPLRKSVFQESEDDLGGKR
ncbi:hypothetical protein ACHAQH_001855 [Verticillium albo-atrum]